MGSQSRRAIGRPTDLSISVKTLPSRSLLHCPRENGEEGMTTRSGGGFFRRYPRMASMKSWTTSRSPMQMFPPK
jgi:hypothetical protein